MSKAMKKTFSKGQHVMIFMDPLTERKREGMAELISFSSSYYDLETWTVRFIGEDRQVERRISTSGHNEGMAKQ